MKMVKIRFANREDSAKGIAKVMRRGQVVCLPENTFIVPEPALDVLNELGLAYEVLNEEGMDSVIHTLRNPAAAAIQ